MRKSLFITIIVSLVISLIPLQLSAAPTITNIELEKLVNGRATLSWLTPHNKTTGWVDFGLSADSMNNRMSYNAYDYRHIVGLTGLQSDKKYYYRIVAVNGAGERTQTYVLTFSTDDMQDTIRPNFESIQVVQATQDAFLLRWETNEETKADIYYGFQSDDLNQHKSYRNFDIDHQLFIYNLDRHSNYYVRVIAYDRDDNKQYSKLINFNTRTNVNHESNIQIDDIQPLSYDPEMIFSHRAVISWETNLAAKSKIYYGAQSEDYDYSQEVNSEQDTQHKAILTELKPNTTYYYQIKVFDAFYRKRTESIEYSFTTQPYNPVYVGQQAADFQTAVNDSDADGLSDEFEQRLGTDPQNIDSDGDGYNDAVEVKYGYDPNGTGRLAEQTFAYLQNRTSFAQEMAQALHLRQLLESQLGQLKLSLHDWFQYVNAYIYGNYPIQAITKAIQHGGKTVHPQIPWDVWRFSADYLENINK